MSNEAILELQKAINAFADGFKNFREEIKGQFAASDARMGLLEQHIKTKLISETGHGDIPKNKWSFARFCAAYALKDWGLAPFEHQEMLAYREKVQQAGNFSTGGALIPAQYSAELITLLRAKLVLSALGVTTMTGLTGSPVIIPKVTGGSTAAWVTEGNPATESTLAVGQVQLTPKKVMALVKISNDLGLLSSPDMEAIVRADIVRSLTDAIEKAFFQGTGVGGQPVGFANQSPAIPSATWVASNDSTRMDSVKLIVQKVDEANALNGSLGFVMTPTIYWLIEKLKANNSTFGTFNYYTGTANTSVQNGPFRNLVGYQVATTTNMTASAIYFGNWADSMLALWSSISVDGSNETSNAFVNDELWIRAIARVDVGIRRGASFIQATSVS